MPRLSKRWIPAALLCSVVLVQRVHVYGRSLTPWMGAGFSMFSTTDDPFARHLRCFALDAGGAEVFRSAPPVSGLPREMLHLPTESRLAPVAAAAAESRCDAPPEIAPEVRRVRVEVWSLDFRAADSTVIPRLVAGVEREVP